MEYPLRWTGKELQSGAENTIKPESHTLCPVEFHLCFICKADLPGCRKQAVTCYGTTNKRITRASIPSIIRYKGITYRVTSVWANAFKNKSRLTTVSIGNNVSVIGKNAFYKCKKLKKVTLGTGLTQINSGAFRGVKKGCTITIKSLKLKKVSSKIDQSTSKMTVCVPRKKYKAYKKILWKKSRTVKIKKF